LTVEDSHGVDRLRDLLAVRTDVLHRRSTDGAGDAGEALDASEVECDGVVDEGIPGLASPCVEYVFGGALDALNCNVKD
jgi:hypothetical protein